MKTPLTVVAALSLWILAACGASTAQSSPGQETLYDTPCGAHGARCEAGDNNSCEWQAENCSAQPAAQAGPLHTELMASDDTVCHTWCCVLCTRCSKCTLGACGDCTSCNNQCAGK
jgi:hypothetical protein